MEARSTSCGLEVALTVIGGKWKPLVLFHLNDGPRRFGALKRLVGGISEKVLIQQLRELADDGVVIRRDFGEVPPKVEYEMTPFGFSLALALRPLCAWGDENRLRIAEFQKGSQSAAA
jgi:DNA-binding HxlR family transcriptional regulator